MRLFRPCLIAGWVYPDAVFRLKTKQKLVCLSFDDGPDPDSTPGLLEILGKHGIQALFFCNGRAAANYPDLVKQITLMGHVVGNHGNTHSNGWITSTASYVADVEDASVYTSSELFRPPFGRLRYSQYRRLKKKYRILFWDLMPYDFDASFGVRSSLMVLRKKIRRGSIIVFHDTRNSLVLDILPAFIDFCKREGYRFVLPEFS
jgi:peptidoglycan/xylan/chitin deacetylase (PgdA/CDA1 family)